MCCIGLVACGIHPRGEKQFAPILHRLYLQTEDPYGQLARSLEQLFAVSHIQFVNTPQQASAILNILKITDAQTLISVDSTQQTRQYTLTTTILFSLTDPAGRLLLPPETLSESRSFTMQSSQILGTSNEAALFYQLMHRALAYAIINRLSSTQVTQQLMRSAI